MIMTRTMTRVMTRIVMIGSKSSFFLDGLYSMQRT
jgi:hypothetical protein